MKDEMVAIAMGVHVLDVLARPVEAIPEGQGATLVEEIRITAAGSAGGAALTLAKLGARTYSAGAIGADAVGEMLTALLEQGGIDTSHLVRRDDVPTSATVLPIRPNGERPTLHLVGANATYGPDDAPWDAISASTHLHLGGPEFMGGEAAARILSFARENGVTTSADILAPGERARDIVDWIAPAFGELDYLLPNDDQVLGLSGADDLAAGCRSGGGRGRLRRGDQGSRGGADRRRRWKRGGPGLQGRGGRHHWLRRRVLCRVPPGPFAGEAPAGGGRARLRGGGARRSGPRKRLRRLRPGRRGRVRHGPGLTSRPSATSGNRAVRRRP